LVKPLVFEDLLKAVADTRRAPAAGPPTSAPSRDGELPVLDAKVFERTAQVIPPDVLDSHLAVIEDRTATLLTQLGQDGPADDQALAALAHALAGGAGTYGFRRVAAAARAFEHAIQGLSAEATSCRDELAGAARYTLVELRHRRASLVPS
jgi:HPt (histidine-containing phosphotransfer) domain-containing protein